MQYDSGTGLLAGVRSGMGLTILPAFIADRDSASLTAALLSAWAITGALSAVIIGLLCIPFACVISAMPLVALIYGVYAGIQCNQGQDFKYWLIGDWFRNILTD